MYQQSIAPAWHTVLVLALLAAGSWLGVYLRMASGNARLPHLELYSLLIVLEWMGFAVVLWRSDATFVTYVAQVLHDPRSLWKDILAAVAIVAGLLVTSAIVVRLLGATGWMSHRGMLPRHGLETVLWMLLAISAGICEEIVFRGYLQQQITAWTGSTSAGIIVQATIFAIGHAYQGSKSVLLIGAWGLVFGVAAWLRRGLRGNMIAHAAIDALAAFSGGR